MCANDTGYAFSFNHRHRRHGQLFQNRYQSILCQEDLYLLELVRYIHLNPLRARLVENLEALATYAYGGHRVMMGNGKQPGQDLERKYRLEADGCDFTWLVKRVAKQYKLEPQQILAAGKYPKTVKARSLLCYWSTRELG